MVTRDHFDRDAGAATGLDGRHGFRPRRIHHGLQTEKHEPSLDMTVGQLVGTVGWDLPRERQYAEAPACQLFGRL
jgi:hypothetical protein